MGKLIAAFLFFLGASGLAIHEAEVPPPPREERVAPPVDETPPSRAIHDDVPPWVKYAAPRAPAPRPVPPPSTIVLPLPPPAVVTLDDGEIGDVIDVVDKCPDQPSDDDDNDGCPEPEGLRDRIILID